MNPGDETNDGADRAAGGSAVDIDDAPDAVVIDLTRPEPEPETEVEAGLPSIDTDESHGHEPTPIPRAERRAGEGAAQHSEGEPSRATATMSAVTDPRMRARRIAVAREQGRRRLRILLVVLGAFVVLGSALLVVQSPFLDVDRIVVTGLPTPGKSAVVAASGVHRGQPLLRVDTGAVARRIEKALPGIGSVSVSRSLPGTLRIVVRQQGVALYIRINPGSVALVGHDGRVVGTAPVPPAGVPELIGSGPAPTAGHHAGPVGVADVKEQLPAALRARVGAINVATPAHIRLYLVGAGEIRLGDLSDLHDKGVAAATVLANIPPTCAWTYIDVEAPTAPVAKDNC